MKATGWMAVLLAAFALPAQAGVWEALEGCWTGTGEVNGMAAEVTLRFRPALEGRGHHLDFRNRMRAADGTPRPFAAEAFYLCDGRPACTGHWYDTRGVILPLTATAQDDRLVVEWGDASSERGRTTYRLRPDGLEITDEVLGKEGKWRVFGRTKATRRP